MRKIFGFLTGIVMGGLVGATLALLFAPESGDALRGQIRDRFDAFQEELAGAASARRVELEKQLSSLRQPKSSPAAEKAK